MSNETKPSPPPVKRREFLKVLGASSAAVAAAGCSEHTGKLIPYLVSPDETVPGVSTYYATTCRECATACGVIAETRDGRTIKLEGKLACNAEITFRLVEFPSPEFRVSMEKVASAISFPFEARTDG